jgi:glucose-1-phosphate thymidylyltransferase
MRANTVKNEVLGVILAGGSGTRLMPLTKDTPKPLLTVGDRPMIFYVMDQVIEAGITDLVLIIKQNMLEKFQRALTGYSNRGLTSINYAFDPEKAKGLIDAITSVKKYTKNKSSLMITCGDVLTEKGFIKFVKEYKSQIIGARILGLETSDTAGFSPLTIKGKSISKIDTKDKNRHGAGAIDSGTYIYPVGVFEKINKLKSRLTDPTILDLNNLYISEKVLSTTVIDGWWSDVGNSLDEYYSADKRYKNLKRLSFMVGIPSYKSGPSIVQAVKSIRASEGVGEFEILVVVDGELDSEIEKQLKILNVKIVKNNNRQGQTAANNIIFKMSQTDITILTQDDVEFQPNSIFKILNNFESDSTLTMVAPKIYPFAPRNIFERSHHFGVFLVHDIIIKWNKGDNYLSSVGRCLAFRTSMIKNFKVPNTIINCDAFYYFENQKLNGRFKYLPEAVVYYRSPSNLIEHTKQIRKFVASKLEIEKHMGREYSAQYLIPTGIFISSLVLKTLKSPILSILYAAISIYTRTRPKSFYGKVSRFWDIDQSTKHI